jgi:hypothetical protein
MPAGITNGRDDLKVIEVKCVAERRGNHHDRIQVDPAQITASVIKQPGFKSPLGHFEISPGNAFFYLRWERLSPMVDGKRMLARLGNAHRVKELRGHLAAKVKTRRLIDK